MLDESETWFKNTMIEKYEKDWWKSINFFFKTLHLSTLWLKNRYNLIMTI